VFRSAGKFLSQPELVVGLFAFIQNRRRNYASNEKYHRHYMTAGGDLIMSGTSAGVGPIQRGDKMECKIEHLSTMTIEVI
jgi:hypothetical protein